MIKSQRSPCSSCYPRLKQKADPNRVCVWGGERSCEVCKSVDNTSHFKRRNTNQTFGIQKGLLDCNSNHVIYVSECKQCQYRFPFVGRTKTKFKYRINNYKSIGKCRKKYVQKDLTIVIKKSELKQNCFTNTTVQKITKVLNIGVSLSQVRMKTQTHQGKRNCVG